MHPAQHLSDEDDAVYLNAPLNPAPSSPEMTAFLRTQPLYMTPEESGEFLEMTEEYLRQVGENPNAPGYI